MTARRTGPWTLLSRHRDYRLLVTAGLVSLTGDYLLRVGLAYLVYDLTGSTLASGATMVASFLPQVLLGSVAGVLVDRWDRRRTMVVSSLLQAAGLLPLLAASPSRIWIVYAVALWQGCVEQFFVPAEQSLVPAVVPEDDLLAANALNGQNRSLARLIGGATGGVVAAWGGLAAVAVIDAATFLVSAALVSTVRTRSAPAELALPERFESEGRVRAALQRLKREWREGLGLVAASPGLRTLLAFAVVTSVGEGVMGTLFAPWVRDVAHGDGRAFGVIAGSQAIGGVAGGFVAASIGGRAGPRALFGWGAVAFGAIDLAMFCYPLLWPTPLPAVAFMIAVGLPGALCGAGAITMLQALTEDRYRGRVLGAIGAAQGVALLLGIGTASLLGETVGILPIISIQGLAYVTGGVVVLLWLPRVRGTGTTSAAPTPAGRR